MQPVMVASHQSCCRYRQNQLLSVAGNNALSTIACSTCSHQQGSHKTERKKTPIGELPEQLKLAPIEELQRYHKSYHDSSVFIDIRKNMAV